MIFRVNKTITTSAIGMGKAGRVSVNGYANQMRGPAIVGVGAGSRFIVSSV